MSEHRLPEGAFIPTHGRGFLKPAKRFEKGNKAGLGNRALKGYGKTTRRKAGEAIAKRFPALASALRTPGPSHRAWWRRRQATLLRELNGNLQATEHILIALMLLRTPAERISIGDTCAHCGLRLEGEALPLVTAALVSGWTHVRCHTAATQAIVMKARLALAQALAPHK